MTHWHYCSNEAFLKIIQTETLRLSDVTRSNDWKEGKLVIELFREMHDSNPEMKFFDAPPEASHQINKVARALGFCMSEDGDLLSQWTAYGDFGSGVAIGFDTSRFREIESVPDEGGATLVLADVVYDRLKQLEELHAFASDTEIKALLSNPPFEFDREAGTKLLKFILSKMYLWKDSSFQEEREKRLIYGLNSIGESADFSEIGMASRRNEMVAFYDLGFSSVKASLITGVVLGPKNTTEIDVLKTWLKSKEYGDVSVEQSKIPFM